MTKLKFKPHPSWPNHGWIEGLTEEDDALLHVDTAEAVIERIEELERKLQEQEDYSEMLIRYMQRTHWWVNFKREYPADAAELEKWLEERHGDDKT